MTICQWKTQNIGFQISHCHQKEAAGSKRTPRDLLQCKVMRVPSHLETAEYMNSLFLKTQEYIFTSGNTEPVEKNKGVYV